MGGQFSRLFWLNGPNTHSHTKELYRIRNGSKKCYSKYACIKFTLHKGTNSFSYFALKKIYIEYLFSFHNLWNNKYFSSAFFPHLKFRFLCCFTIWIYLLFLFHLHFFVIQFLRSVIHFCFCLSAVRSRCPLLIYEKNSSGFWSSSLACYRGQCPRCTDNLMAILKFYRNSNKKVRCLAELASSILAVRMP